MLLLKHKNCLARKEFWFCDEVLCIISSVAQTIDKGSYMSAHVLLSQGGKDQMQACQAFYLFFATSLIKSIKHEHEC